VSVIAAPPGILADDALVAFAMALATSSRRRGGLVEAASGTRHYDTIWADEHVNAWLIRWSGDADTGFHDHDVSAAGIVVLDGIVIEERLTLHGAPIARRFGPGERFQLAPSAIHRVRHGGGPPALTIHAYSPPLQVQGVYRVAADGALERDAVPYTEELRAQPTPIGARP